MEQIQEETILALLIDKPAEGIRILTAQYGGLVYSITWRRLQGCLRKEDIEECVSARLIVTVYSFSFFHEVLLQHL